jgi:hypothetical protein
MPTHNSFGHPFINVKVVAAAISAETHTHPSIQTHNKTRTSPPQFPPQLFQASSNIAAAAVEPSEVIFS